MHELVMPCHIESYINLWDFQIHTHLFQCSMMNIAHILIGDIFSANNPVRRSNSMLAIISKYSRWQWLKILKLTFYDICFKVCVYINDVYGT